MHVFVVGEDQVQHEQLRRGAVAQLEHGSDVRLRDRVIVRSYGRPYI